MFDASFQTMITLFLISLAGYLCGSFPTGYVAVKIKTGQDLRILGSGNVGATNAGRVLGRSWGIIVALVDMLKGGVAVLLCRFFFPDDLAVSLCAAAAVLGHNYPVWLRFQGGKGVATTMGTLFFVAPLFSCIIVLASGGLWLVVLFLFRYVSLASLVALLSLPVMASMTALGWARGFVVLSLFLALLSCWRHRENLRRLCQGTESKIGQK